MADGTTKGWATEEMGQAALGDKRLNTRLISICAVLRGAGISDQPGVRELGGNEGGLPVLRQ
jgi:hypothetical protein